MFVYVYIHIYLSKLLTPPSYFYYFDKFSQVCSPCIFHKSLFRLLVL